MDNKGSGKRKLKEEKPKHTLLHTHTQ